MNTKSGCLWNVSLLLLWFSCDCSVEGFSFSSSNTIVSLNRHCYSTMNGRDGSLSMSLQEFAARDLVIDLIGEAGCFNSMEGIQKLVNACESGVVYEDGMEAVPIVGKSNVANFLSSSSTKHRRRLDKVSDGTTACGYTWTWITDNEEGLRGTTFVQLNPQSGLIQYICELFEPVVKPGDAIVDLLKTVTQDYVADEEKEETKFAIRTPTKASDIASYMFQEVQVQNVTDVVRFYSPDIVYQDFNYPKAFRGVEEAKEFLEKFISIQGIDFIPIQFDDGQTSTCFTWKIQVMDAPDSILGISFYETNEDGKISFIRDIAESAIKPPILGSIARKLRPQLGVFSPLPLGSRLFGIS